MPELLTIRRSDFDQMLAHLRAVYPQEGCGLLAGIAEQAHSVHPIENMLHSPVAYEMEPQQQIETMLAIEATGMEIVAIYHSHPHGPNGPSETDVAHAYYPDIRQIIVSLADPNEPTACAYWMTMTQVRQIEIRIV